MKIFRGIYPGSVVNNFYALSFEDNGLSYQGDIELNYARAHNSWLSNANIKIINAIEKIYIYCGNVCTPCVDKCNVLL